MSFDSAEAKIFEGAAFGGAGDNHLFHRQIWVKPSLRNRAVNTSSRGHRIVVRVTNDAELLNGTEAGAVLQGFEKPCQRGFAFVVLNLYAGDIELAQQGFEEQHFLDAFADEEDWIFDSLWNGRFDLIHRTSQ